MDFTLLKYFSVVAETRHMTKAAKILNISQPSLSSAIKRLELEVGFELFDRSTRNIELNDYGRIFLDSTVAIEKEYISGLNRMNELKKLKENSFNLCIPSSPAKHYLMETLLSEGFTVIFSNLPDNWQQSLFDSKIDLVATLEKFDNPRIQRLLLYYNELVIVSSRNHPLASMEHITVGDINKYTFSSTPTQHSPLICAKNQLDLNGLKPRVTFFANGIANVIHSIKSTDRLGLMVKHHLPPDHGLVLLSVENLHISLPTYLYWKADNSKRSIDRVIEHIKDYYRQL